MNKRLTLSKLNIGFEEVDKYINATSDNIVICNPNEEIIFVNKSFEKLTGYSANEVLGKTPRMLKSGEHNQEFYKKMWDTLKGGRIFSAAFYNKKKNGEFYWVENTIIPMFNNEGELIYVVSSGKDISESKKALHHLAEEKEKLQLAQEISDLGFLVWDLKTDRLELSDVALKIFGIADEHKWAPDNLINSMMHTEDADRVKKGLEEAIKENKTFNLDHRIARADGSIIWVNAVAKLMENKLGSSKILLGTIKDITKRKKYEERRVLSAIILEKLNSIVVSGNSDGIITFVSPSIERIMGYSIQEVLGEGWWNLTYVSNEESLKTKDKLLHFIKVIKEKKSSIFLRKVQCKNGEIKWIEWIVSKGNENQFFAIGNDVTERKIADDKLRQLSQALEKSPVSIIITDIEGKIEYVNKHYEKFTGYNLAHSKGDIPSMLQYKNNSLEEYNNRWNTIKSGKIWKEEMLSKKKNGEIYWELVTISPLFNDNQQITHYQLVREDITDKKILEGEFYNSLINSHENEKQRLGENLHERLAQKLTTMSMYLEILSKNNMFEEETTNYIKILKELNKEAIYEAVSLSYDIMSKQLKKYGLLYSVKEVCYNLNTKQPIKFSFSCNQINEDDIENEVKLNLFRIIQELVTNVVKHSFADYSNIILSIDNNKFIKLIVIDDGKGFELQKLKSDKGIGFQNIKKRLELLHGKMIRRSNNNQGTIITIKIPLHTYLSSKYFKSTNLQ